MEAEKTHLRVVQVPHETDIERMATLNGSQLLDNGFEEQNSREKRAKSQREFGEDHGQNYFTKTGLQSAEVWQNPRRKNARLLQDILASICELHLREKQYSSGESGHFLHQQHQLAFIGLLALRNHCPVIGQDLEAVSSGKEDAIGIPG